MTSRGFSLVELCVCFALVASAGVLVFTLSSAGSLEVADLVDRTRSAELADRILTWFATSPEARLLLAGAPLAGPARRLELPDRALPTALMGPELLDWMRCRGAQTVLSCVVGPTRPDGTVAAGLCVFTCEVRWKNTQDAPRSLTRTSVEQG